MIAQERVSYDQMLQQMEAVRATYAFPASIVTLPGSATLVFFLGTILLTATTIGDEFSWGTIRTTLLASSNRRRWLGVRLGLVVGVAAVWFAALMLLSLVLPFAIAGVVGPLPASPSINAGALAVVVGGHLLEAVMLVGFAAAATVLVRSATVALVVAFLYSLVDAVILGLVAQLGPPPRRTHP